jgi:hypothetical protein
MSESADNFIQTLESAKELNLRSRFRTGNLLTLPRQGEVWMTGDIHDHRNNFNKFVKLARLKDNPDRHIILHELIHGDHIDPNGAEDSWKMLRDAARLKVEFPDQVHFLLANHDLAQVFGEGIAKGGSDVCEAFRKGLKRDFPERYHFAESAISEFLLSLPLAIRTQNGLWFSHSLPREDQVESFDFSVFARELSGDDYKRKTGAAYNLIWGRGIRETGVDLFAEEIGAELLITGHQPQESGFEVNGSRHLIIASDHNQGVFLPLSLEDEYDMATLVSRLKKFVAVVLPDE